MLMKTKSLFSKFTDWVFSSGLSDAYQKGMHDAEAGIDVNPYAAPTREYNDWAAGHYMIKYQVERSW